MVGDIIADSRATSPGIRSLDERIETVTAEIEQLSRIEPKCQRLIA
jgi:hypothetical protein